jgi:hypothetical protein
LKRIKSRFLSESAALGRFTERVAARLVAECTDVGIQPEVAQLVVMWGGGKDSTFALLAATAVAELTGCRLKAVTMLHPGLSEGTFRNIKRILREVGVPHEFRVFAEVSSHQREGLDRWRLLYRLLAHATGFHPRFMCVACNFGSVVVEYAAMSEANANFLVTGNPRSETATFEGWADSFRTLLSGQVELPARSGGALLDWYRLWWVVYDKLLSELKEVGRIAFRMDEQEVSQLNRYLYEYPTANHTLATARTFAVMEDDEAPYEPSELAGLLTACGWELPIDIPAGTESDCLMPAAIAKLHIHRNGLESHLEQLKIAADVLRPSAEMYDRAVSWARNGRSESLGRELLDRMGVGEVPHQHTETAIAGALVRQLLPVR